MKQKMEIDLAQAEELAAHGLTLEQIAVALGISTRTLYNRRRDFADFADAIKKGKARGVADVASKLYDLAMAGNVTAIIFYLKTRAGWSERQIVEQKTDLSEREVAKRLTTEELLKIAGKTDTTEPGLAQWYERINAECQALTSCPGGGRVARRPEARLDRAA